MHSDTLVYQLSITGYVMKKNLEGFTHEESLQKTAGNNVNWVFGHVVQARNRALKLVGKEPLFQLEKFAAYEKTPIADSTDAIRLEELIEIYDALEKPLCDGIKELSAETFAAPAKINPLGSPDETVGSLLAAITFHEAYHAGQIGLLRRLVGKPGAIGAPG